MVGTSLVVQCLRLQAFNARGPGLIPSQGTRSCKPQPRVHMLQLKISWAATDTWCSQINTHFFNLFKEKRGDSFCSDLALSHLTLPLQHAGKENFERLEAEPDSARDSWASAPDLQRMAFQRG